MPRPSRHALACGVVAGTVTLAVSVLATSAPSIASPGTPAAAAAAVPRHSVPAASTTALTGPRTVTLVTGDRVTLVLRAGGQPRVLVDGSSGHDMQIRREGGRIEVIPRDLVGLVPTVLDPDLFDVAGLVAAGYDDSHRATVPLIAHRATGVHTLAAEPGLRADRNLPSIHADAMTLTKSDAAAFGRELASVRQGAQVAPRAAAADALGGIDHLWLDAPLTAAGVTGPAAVAAPTADSGLDPYLTQIGAPAAWDAGLDGTGVKVAVLDTGIDTAHPALAGKVSLAANFTDAPEVGDVAGHGTHVASLLAGSGAGSDGARQGIAPAVDLISGKVLGDEEQGLQSWAIAGAQWAVDQGADVVNMSLSGASRDSDDPLVQAIDALTASSGTLFVVAAGNAGTLGDSPLTITSPGTAASALTVGAVTAQDAMAGFSSEGPTRGSYRTKPDVAAPGVEILGARVGARTGDPDLYVPMSGTSMATPIVAGAAALAMQEHPAWTWQQVKSAIADDAQPVGTAWTQGGGRLALDRLIDATVTAQPSTLSPGPFLHPDDGTWHTDVTLTNTGPASRTFTVTDAETGSGEPAPDAALVASPTSVTVAPGGTATLSVTFDAGQVPDGYWQGYVDLAGDDGSSLRLPFGTYDEPERYALDLTVLDRSGQPWAGGDVPLQNLDTGGFVRAILDEQGHASLRLPPGHWTAFARIETPPSDDDPGSLVIAGTTDVDLHAATSVTIDARKAVRLRPPSVAGTPTRAAQFSMVYSARADDGQGYTELVFPTIDEVNGGRVYVAPTGAAQAGSFEVATHWRLEPTRPGHGAPTAYEVQEVQPRFTDPLYPDLSRRDVQRMARTTLRYSAARDGDTETVETVTQTPNTDGVVVSRQISVPRTEVELATADPAAAWGRCVIVPQEQVTELCGRELAAYQPGTRSTVDIGQAIHPDVFDVDQGRGWFHAQQGLADGERSGLIGAEAVESADLALYRNGDLVSSVPDFAGWFDVPPEEASYRLVGDLRLRAGTLPVDAHTEWTFRSGEPTDESVAQTIPPLITIDYGPSVDPLGRAHAGRPLTFDLGFGQQAGSPAIARITRASLSWSDDGGRHWHALAVRRTGAKGYAAMIPGPQLRRGTTLSLRVSAADSAGDAVDQTERGLIPVG